MYDFIGDIHGHASELVDLLAALGCSKHKGVYKHHERRAIFLGDFIDRGPPERPKDSPGQRHFPKRLTGDERLIG